MKKGVSMHFKKFLIILSAFLLILGGSVSAEDTEDIESTEEILEGLLEGNLYETDFTALVTYQKIKVADSFGGYKVLQHDCSVLEIYKGNDRKDITFFHMVDADMADNVISKKQGKTYIVSLSRDETASHYHMGDNGYEIPGEERYIRFAKTLKAKL